MQEGAGPVAVGADGVHSSVPCLLLSIRIGAATPLQPKNGCFLATLLAATTGQTVGLS